jgi:hypothetical protein
MTRSTLGGDRKLAEPSGTQGWPPVIADFMVECKVRCGLVVVSGSRIHGRGGGGHHSWSGR